MTQMKAIIDSIVANNQEHTQLISQTLNWIWLTGGTVFGSIIGWWLKHFRVKVEIKKLKSEIDQLNLENVVKIMEITDKVIIKRNDFNDKGKELERLLQDCFDSITERNLDKFKLSREATNRFYFHTYYSSFTDYFDIFSSAKTNDSTERKHFVEEKVVPFLRTTNNFLEVVNLESLINRANLTKIRITKETMQYLKRFSIQNLDKKDKTIKNEVNYYFDKICKQ